MRKALCLLLSLLLPIGAIAEGGDTLSDTLDRIFKRYDTMGATVCVFQNGEVVSTYAYGLASLKGSVPASESTMYQVGSVSKLVAAIGVMQLVETGALSLDGDLSDILGFRLRNPQYPDKVITLRQLMCHTAGLRDSGHYNLALQGSPLSLDKLFGERHASLQFLEDCPPGKKSEYSNLGGGILGTLIELASGQALDEYMTEHVFAPLGITAAYQPALLDESRVLACQYQMPEKRLTQDLRAQGAAAKETDALRDYTYTAGKLIISAPDLCKLLIALCDGGVWGNARLLKPSTVSEMLTPQNARGTVTGDSGMGLCVFIRENVQVEGRTLYGHGGKAHGMLCAAYFDPTDRTGVVMLTNGCNNSKVYQGVGMLGRQVLTACYEAVIGDAPEVENPFLVKD